MRKLFLLLLVVFLPLSTHAAVPGLVQNVIGPTAGSTGGVNSYVLPITNPTLSGNLIVFTITTGASNTVTVTDDKSNTYITTGPSVTGSQFVKLFYVANATAGVTKITASFSSGQNFIQGLMSEFNNIALTTPADGTSTGSSSGTSVATGAIVTGTAGDLIYHVGWQDTGGATTSITQGTSPFKLLAVDLANANIGAMGAQYEIQASAGSITPAFTMAPTNHFDTVAIAFKSAAAGTAPAAGIRIVTTYHATISGAAASPLALQFPTTGNLLIATTLMIDALSTTGITDGNSNTWAFAGAGFSLTGSGKLRIGYAAAASTSTTMTGPTITFTGANTSGDTIVFYDVTGAAASPFDSTAGNPTASGTDATGGSHTVSTVAINPSTANGLVVSMVGVTNPEPVNAVTPGNLVAATSSPEASSGDMDENNGWAIQYNAVTGSRTYVYTMPGGAAGNWAAMAAAFKAPTPTPTNQFPRVY